MIEEIKRSRNTSFIRKDGRYYLREYNPYTHGVSLSEIHFDENGKAELRDGHVITHYEKEKIDILFVTDGRILEEKQTPAEKLADMMNSDDTIPDSAIDEFGKNPEGTIQKYEKK